MSGREMNHKFPQLERLLSYNAASFSIPVDNCSNKYMPNSKGDFVGELLPVRTTIKWRMGQIIATLKGTVHWRIQDDEGKVHVHSIPDTYFTPGVISRLLSSQHWDQVASDNFPRRRSTCCHTYDDEVELCWGQRKFQRTVKLSTSNNVANFRSAPGYENFKTFASHVEEPKGMSLNVISDDEMSVQGEESPDIQAPQGDVLMGNELLKIVFDLKDPSNFTEHEQDLLENPQAELLKWHYTLGNISSAKLQLMAKTGNLP